MFRYFFFWLLQHLWLDATFKDAVSRLHSARNCLKPKQLCTFVAVVMVVVHQSVPIMTQILHDRAISTSAYLHIPYGIFLCNAVHFLFNIEYERYTARMLNMLYPVAYLQKAVFMSALIHNWNWLGTPYWDTEGLTTSFSMSALPNTQPNRFRRLRSFYSFLRLFLLHSPSSQIPCIT